MRVETITLIACAAGLIACEREVPSSPDEDGVECVGARPEDAAIAGAHARLFRGEVRAVAPRARRSSWELIPTARAFALDAERPVEGAVVSLVRVDARGQRLEAPLRQATTDARGRYCLMLPEGVSPGPSLMLVARRDELKLRHLAISVLDADLNAQTEALVAVLLDEQVPLDALRAEAWLDVRTLADTAVGLFGEVEGEGVTAEALVADMKEALVKDERFMREIGREPRSLE